MSYYRGDYYRGDYYRGDPGLFGSIGKFVGGALKTVGGIASKIPGVGGIVGTAASIAGGLLSSATGGAAPQTISTPAALPMLSMTAALPALPPGPGTMITGPKGQAVGISPLGTLGVSPAARGVGHLNKHGYYTKAGYVAPYSKVVPSRHMNVGNARALKRALRRAHGFARLARHVMSYEITGKHHSRGHFKARRRSR